MENVFIQTAEDFDATESSFEVKEEPEEYYANESSFTVKMEVEEDPLAGIFLLSVKAWTQFS